jgi:3-hydroxyisobutyrate dehydrogenase
MAEEKTVIGFIGTGIMGRPMAEHLLRAGHTLYVHNRTQRKAQPLIDAGAHWCDTSAHVARAARMILLNVTDTPDVEAVLFGDAGVASAIQPQTTVVDFSTISPQQTRAMATRLAEHGAQLLDAPVTGGDSGAKAASLTIMVGGECDAFERVRPILEHLGRRIVYVGPSGSGQTLKACNQILCAANLMGVCEALLLAEKNGLDRQQMVDTLATGAGGSWALQELGAKINADDLEPAFMVRLLQKDLRLVQEAGEQQHVPLPATSLAQQLFRAVAALPDGADQGTQALIRVYRQLAGPPAEA